MPVAVEADAVLDGPIGQKVMDKLQEKGLVGLVYWENGFLLSSKFFEVQKYLSVTNHVTPWIMLASKKWWDQLSKAEQKVLLDAARASREFERRDTR